MRNTKSHQQGFTLLEMILVLVIATSLLLMFLNFSTLSVDKQRRDRMVMQMQQILNAALAYYVNNGTWPDSTNPKISCATPTNGVLITASQLSTSNYLPGSTTWNNPYGSPYLTCIDLTKNNYYVVSQVTTATIATGSVTAGVIAGQLPFGITEDVASGNLPAFPFTQSYNSSSQAACLTTKCAAIVNVPPPGQNLNNARSVNFASVYTSGQCVPVPNCPTGMTPQIFAVPVQVSGTYDNTGSASNPPVYPISSYTAYATAKANNPANCAVGANQTCNPNSNITGGNQNQYWRVCLSVTTEKGVVSPSSAIDTSNMGSIMAITRCQPGSGVGPFEPTGSTFNVYN